MGPLLEVSWDSEWQVQDLEKANGEKPAQESRNRKQKGDREALARARTTEDKHTEDQVSKGLQDLFCSTQSQHSVNFGFVKDTSNDIWLS